MATTPHSTLTGAELHVPFKWIQSTDPGGSASAGDWWADTANNLIKQRDPTNTFWTAFGGSGGGGSLPNWLSMSADNYPASPNALNDEFESGSLNAAWNWTNQNGTVAAFQGSLMRLRKTVDENNLTLLLKSFTGTGNFTTKLWLPSFTNTNGTVGFAIGDSTTGRIQFIYAAGSAVAVQNWTTYASFSSQPASQNIFQSFEYIYLRITLDATNLTYQYSFDGLFYESVYQVAKATWLTGGQNLIGYMVRPVTSTPMSLVTDFFRVL